MKSNDEDVQSTLNHLFAKADAQTYRIGKVIDVVTSLEEKVDGLNTLQADHTDRLNSYNSQLAVHIARSEAIQKHVDLLEQKLSSFPTRLLQIISIVGGLAALAKLLR